MNVGTKVKVKNTDLIGFIVSQDPYNCTILPRWVVEFKSNVLTTDFSYKITFFEDSLIELTEPPVEEDWRDQYYKWKGENT